MEFQRPDSSQRIRAIVVATCVHVGRFGVIIAAVALAPAFGITGWWAGLFANVCCVAYAVILVSVLRLWKTIGLFRAWAGPVAACLLLYPLAETLSWIVPAGLEDRPPGPGWWALTLVLVGVNEELVSRGVVLERLRPNFAALPAVGVTAMLFGLQHLSLFATTGRSTFDILTNVAASACYGFGMAAFQYRFHWIAPLILLHAASDFTTTLSREPFGDLGAALISVGYLAFGWLILATGRKASDTGSPDSTELAAPGNAETPGAPGV